MSAFPRTSVPVSHDQQPVTDGYPPSASEWGPCERFQELKTHEDDWTVHVRPEQVVEIAFDGLQRSSRYPGGVALRFARVVRYRDDKTADQADTIETVRQIATRTG
ncbi:ATP dependent DNA ligase [Nocardioides bizhenqiangii]|uniref:DNA ligase (ATP) n=1 Tax=Nocardioides bizhenqiangii TaxID=3095076 RepID=A0ABZ0ZKG4_9ACTN|nr:hypothetical protein [Nocardioides sp. HM61]WQQ24881.1 hypothetical protein SHK19_12975 [Nocardioides sp. HM61]